MLKTACQSIDLWAILHITSQEVKITLFSTSHLPISLNSIILNPYSFNFDIAKLFKRQSNVVDRSLRSTRIDFLQFSYSEVGQNWVFFPLVKPRLYFEGKHSKCSHSLIFDCLCNALLFLFVRFVCLFVLHCCARHFLHLETFRFWISFKTSFLVTWQNFKVCFELNFVFLARIIRCPRYFTIALATEWLIFLRKTNLPPGSESAFNCVSLSSLALWFCLLHLVLFFH